jgi:hypothetical protein
MHQRRRRGEILGNRRSGGATRFSFFYGLLAPIARFSSLSRRAVPW